MKQAPYTVDVDSDDLVRNMHNMDTDMEGRPMPLKHLKENLQTLQSKVCSAFRFPLRRTSKTSIVTPKLDDLPSSSSSASLCPMLMTSLSDEHGMPVIPPERINRRTKSHSFPQFRSLRNKKDIQAHIHATNSYFGSLHAHSSTSINVTQLSRSVTCLTVPVQSRSAGSLVSIRDPDLVLQIDCERDLRSLEAESAALVW